MKNTNNQITHETIKNRTMAYVDLVKFLRNHIGFDMEEQDQYTLLKSLSMSSPRRINELIRLIEVFMKSDSTDELVQSIWDAANQIKNQKTKKSRNIFRLSFSLAAIIYLFMFIFDWLHVRVNYRLNGGYFPLSTSESTSINLALDYSLPIPLKEGYEFIGWYTDTQLNKPLDSFPYGVDEITLYAKWTIGQFSITFEENGGFDLSDLSFYYKDIIQEIKEPQKEDCKFMGWFEDVNLTVPFNEYIMPGKDFTLYAKWSEYYAIDYSINGGQLPLHHVTSYITENKVSLPTPKKVGYSFLGWFDNENFSGRAITEIPVKSIGDKHFFAKWEINRYTITFEDNGGTPIEAINDFYGEPLMLPQNLEKTGYTFGGWFLDAAFNEAIDYDKIPAEDIVLYAHWNINQYNILFNENGGNSVEDMVVDYNQLVNTLPIPIKEGYTFAGWFKDSALDMKVDLFNMAANDVVLYAKWVINEYNIHYISNIPNHTISKEVYPFNQVITLKSEWEINGFTFQGWFLDGDFIERVYSSTIPSHDITLYAYFLLNDDFEITLKGETNVVLERGSVYLDEGVFCRVEYEMECTATVISNQLVNSVPGQYSIIYGLADIFGNYVKTAERQIQVVDTISPVIISQISNNSIYKAINIETSELIKSYSIDGGNTWISTGDTTHLTFDSSKYSFMNINLILVDKYGNQSSPYYFRIDNTSPSVSNQFSSYRYYDYFWEWYTTVYSLEIKITDDSPFTCVIYRNGSVVYNNSSSGTTLTYRLESYYTIERNFQIVVTVGEDTYTFYIY